MRDELEGLLGEAGPAEVRREEPGYSQDDAHGEKRRRGDGARPPADRGRGAPAGTVRGSVLTGRTGELAVRSGAAARNHNGLAGRLGRLAKRGGILTERSGVLVDLHGTRANRGGTRPTGTIASGASMLANRVHAADQPSAVSGHDSSGCVRGAPVIQMP